MLSETALSLFSGVRQSTQTVRQDEPRSRIHCGTRVVCCLGRSGRLFIDLTEGVAEGLPLRPMGAKCGLD